MLPRNGLFFISDYRDVTCDPGRDPSFWILKALNKDASFDVHSTANTISYRHCFENIDFLPLNFRGSINIQIPKYNYSIYKAYKKVESKVNVIHHCEKFQYEKGYNLIPLLSNLDDKNLIIGPVQFPHKVFENDYLVGKAGLERIIHKSVFKSKYLLNPLFSTLFKKTIMDADKVIVPNQYVKKSVKKYVSPKDIKIINYGVDLELYNNYSYCADENNFKIVFPSMAIERKGVEYLLNAISILKNDYPSVKLCLLSNGYLINMYKKMSEEMGISENVFFYGTMSKKDYLDFLSGCRILCLPTLSEGYGWTILDALCLGVPVVTTDKCGCPELFENGNIGSIVKSGDSYALAEAISKLFENYDLCKKLSENGLRKREQYDYGKIVFEYLELYEQFK
ncbi:glycosyltransferase involved in cell wall biosynthesis [Methanohalophilus levihalophilus]|uniref:glycosyltransferase n=1 Tax=Methanohalophilus levihalophilus TaxID=1431282 RepID=UPI001AE5C4DA|nr:glycosyltransferase [Methanohalophilus levihalophilus]MBP2029951.1 glycosyltransferase involved in cell wall biosynthesis [Methanohalophilus levihalophilus]